MPAGRSDLAASRRFVAVCAALGFATTLIVSASLPDKPQGNALALISDVRLQWAEVKWPFPVDLWSGGKAFECAPSHCGGSVRLYLRAKLGFCNCKTGVADDDELERVADLDLLGGQRVAIGAGRSIAVSSMKGRSRTYFLSNTVLGGKSALSLAFNDRCDVIVGTVILDHHHHAETEHITLEFLNSDAILKWAQVTLGL